ncbi:thioredoxin family protein [Aliibacillus thermotolerans]|uniref:Thioredoxin family protein n=1 Tax=Aliibacillus thermotolerans TaxID=1834418 RepID=A0ABW0U6L0_9BACI|nr:thioredoxin family protein [Aliibacillus thermotolerans]MDA3130147.1 thioredoxin [Aliibacillus thermotolerans]
MEEKSEEELKEEMSSQNSFVLFLYSPFCGTCQLAERMVEVLEKLYPSIPFVKGNVNLLPAYVHTYQVTSIPALHVCQDGKVVKKIYAFHSVPSLMMRLDSFLHLSEADRKEGNGCKR